MMGAEGAIGRKLIAEIDAAELTIRLLEIGIRLKRPPGKTAEQIMETVHLSATDGRVPADIVGDFERMATAAIMYFGECCANLRAVQ